jgi:hypothetical protein
MCFFYIVSYKLISPLLCVIVKNDEEMKQFLTSVHSLLKKKSIYSLKGISACVSNVHLGLGCCGYNETKSLNPAIFSSLYSMINPFTGYERTFCHGPTITQ